MTAFALGVGLSMGGNVVIETVFSWPGIGRMLVQAVSVHDYPLAQGAFLMIALVLALMNFVADLLYMVLDPRVSHGRRAEPLPPGPAGALSPIVRRLLTMPLRDPFAFAGILIYVLFVDGGAHSPTSSRPIDPMRDPVHQGGQGRAPTCRPSAEYLLGTTNLGRDI